MFKAVAFLFLICIQQGSSFPSGEEEGAAAGGGVKEYAKGLWKQYVEPAKGDLLKSGFDMLGLEQPNLNDTLSAMKIEPAIIANLTGSFSDPGKLLEAFTQPEKLTTMLTEHTGMDEATITGFVDTVKNTFKSGSGEPGSAMTSQ